MNKLFHILRLLSLDVVLGALASAYMVIRLTEVEMPEIFWVALPLSVWVIYTADHLLDAYRLKADAHTARHLFHYRYFREIAIAFCLGAAICILVFPFLIPVPMLLFAVIMGIFTAVHFLLVKWVGDRISWFFLKELGVGGIYAAGVWGGAMAMKSYDFSFWELNFFLQFFLLAMINLLSFSMYEMETDKLDGHSSFALALGKKGSKRTIYGLVLVNMFLAIWGLFQSPEYLFFCIQIILFGMLAVLLWVVVDEKRFGKSEAYRAWADAVFMFPSLLFFC